MIKFQAMLLVQIAPSEKFPVPNIPIALLSTPFLHSHIRLQISTYSSGLEKRAGKISKNAVIEVLVSALLPSSQNLASKS